MTNIQYYSGAIDAGGCISNGWNLVKPNYWMFFGITVLAMVIVVVVSCIPCVNFFLMGPIFGGVYYVFLREMRGETVDFGMMFKGFEKFVSLMVVGLIQSIPGIISLILQYAFNIADIFIKISQGGRRGDFYQESGAGEIALAGGLLVVVIIFVIVFTLFSIAWGISFAFAVPLVMEHDEIGPIEALKLSARAAWGNVGGIIVLAILNFLIALAGTLALCVGVLFVLPIIYASYAFAYRQVFPDLGGGPKLHTTPPPPHEYAGSFGQGM